MSIRRPRVLVIATAPMLLMLAACSSRVPDLPGEPPTVSIVRPSASPTSAVPEVLDGAIQHVRVSGRLSGPVSATFSVTHDGRNDPVLHLRGARFRNARDRTVELATEVDDLCGTGGIAFTAGTLTSAANQDVLLTGAPTLPLNDLSYLKALAITPEGGAGNECTLDRFSSARLQWAVPAAVRGLAAHDLGPAENARGAVRTRSGRRSRYVVASNDTTRAVAAPVGITADDLLYLNPFRRRGDDPLLYAGEGLNLDPLDRQWF